MWNVYGNRLEKRQRLLQRKEARLIASCEALSGVNHNSSSSSSSKSRKHNKSVVDLTNVTICEQIGRGASGANVFSAIVDGWYVSCCTHVSSGGVR